MSRSRKHKPLPTPFILYRESEITPAEMDAIVQSPHGTEIDQIPANSVVFPRFRSIPFGKELEEAVIAAGSQLINSWEQYKYIADVFAWAKDLGDLTPTAYHVGDELPEGEFFVKGITNSVKHDWFNSAFASSREDVQRVIDNIANSPVVGNQELVIRPFVHYRQLATQESGQPVFNEWRVFIHNRQVVGEGFYWMSQTHLFDGADAAPLNEDEFRKTIGSAMSRIDKKASFYALDIAEKTDSTWDVIEINDGNMSGLTGVDPEILWDNIDDSYRYKP